jgi:hypothetical protein
MWPKKMPRRGDVEMPSRRILWPSCVIILVGHHLPVLVLRSAGISRPGGAGRCVGVCVVGCCARSPAACAAAVEHTTNVTIHFESWVHHLHLILYEALPYDQNRVFILKRN